MSKVDKYSTKYIGKSPKKNKKQEAIEKLTANLPSSWQEAYSQLSNSISQIGSVVGGIASGTAKNNINSNQWYGQIVHDWTYRPDPNMYTKPTAIPNLSQDINWTQYAQDVMFKTPNTRFFASSGNGVFFPCQ